MGSSNLFSHLRPPYKARPGSSSRSDPAEQMSMDASGVGLNQRAARINLPRSHTTSVCQRDRPARSRFDGRFMSHGEYMTSQEDCPYRESPIRSEHQETCLYKGSYTTIAPATTSDVQQKDATSVGQTKATQAPSAREQTIYPFDSDGTVGSGRRVEGERGENVGTKDLRQLSSAPLSGSAPSMMRPGKQKRRFLSHMSLLLLRRRSSQITNDNPNEDNVRGLTIPAMAIPDNYDPRIRGNVIHDFSAPRPKVMPRRDDNPRSFSPDKHLEPSQTSTVGVLKLQFDDGITTQQSESHTTYNANSAVRYPESLSFQSSFVAGPNPSFPPGNEFHTSIEHGDTHSATETGKGAQYQPDLEHPRPHLEASSELQSDPDQMEMSSVQAEREPSSTRVEHLPRHMRSTSSRFSFDSLGVGSAAQELLLEDKHRYMTSIKGPSARPLTRQRADTLQSSLGDPDESSPYISHSDDGILMEEEVPGVNVDADEYSPSELDAPSLSPRISVDTESPPQFMDDAPLAVDAHNGSQLRNNTTTATWGTATRDTVSASQDSKWSTEHSLQLLKTSMECSILDLIGDETGDPCNDGVLIEPATVAAQPKDASGLGGKLGLQCRNPETFVTSAYLSDLAGGLMGDFTGLISGTSHNEDYSQIDDVSSPLSGLQFDASIGDESSEPEDDSIIALANAEALACDSDGFYGQEFGFYAHPGRAEAGEYTNGGYFGQGFHDDLNRSHSGNATFQEPNLTPITERSEYSTRNSFIVPPLSGSVPMQCAQSPGLMELASMLDPLNEDYLSLAKLQKLRKEAWGGSTTSLQSAAGSLTGHSVEGVEVGGSSLYNDDSRSTLGLCISSAG